MCASCLTCISSVSTTLYLKWHASAPTMNNSQGTAQAIKLYEQILASRYDTTYCGMLLGGIWDRLVNSLLSYFAHEANP